MLDDGVTVLQTADGDFISSTGGIPSGQGAELQGGIRANMGERWVCWDRATRCPRPCGVWQRWRCDSGVSMQSWRCGLGRRRRS